MALPLSYNIRSLYVCRKMTALAVGGIALVIAMLIVVIAMANGFRVARDENNRALASPELIAVANLRRKYGKDVNSAGTWLAAGSVVSSPCRPTG